MEIGNDGSVGNVHDDDSVVGLITRAHELGQYLGHIKVLTNPYRYLYHSGH